MYKYALLRKQEFSVQKNIVNRFYKTASSSRFLCHQFHIKKVISESKPSCHIDIYFFLSVSSTQETADGKPEVECQEDITHII